MITCFIKVSNNRSRTMQFTYEIKLSYSTVVICIHSNFHNLCIYLLLLSKHALFWPSCETTACYDLFKYSLIWNLNGLLLSSFWCRIMILQLKFENKTPTIISSSRLDEAFIETEVVSYAVSPCFLLVVVIIKVLLDV